MTDREIQSLMNPTIRIRPAVAGAKYERKLADVIGLGIGMLILAALAW